MRAYIRFCGTRIGKEDKTASLGDNAARLFRSDRPEIAAMA
jgi:hypothetical protein